MTLRVLCFVLAFLPSPASLMFTVPLYADRWNGGQGMGTAIALAITIGIWLACLITTLAAIGMHAGIAPLRAEPSIRELAQAEWGRKILGLGIRIGAIATFVGLSGVIWIMLPVSPTGTSIAFNEEESGFLAANVLVTGLIVCIAANGMAKTEKRITDFINHEKTRPA